VSKDETGQQEKKKEKKKKKICCRCFTKPFGD